MTDKTMEASRRYSPFKFTKSTTERAEQYSPAKSAFRSRLQPHQYYCHYSNATYMGGVDSFKKNGQGILLLDSGACAVTNFSHDTMLGLNLIFRNGSMTVLTVRPNKSKSVSFRTGPYLATLHYSPRGVLEKVGYLVDYELRKLFRISFFQSKVDKKQEILSKAELAKIFDSHDYSSIVEDPNHVRMLKLDFKFSDEIQCMQTGKCLRMGFVSREGQTCKSNGLGFEMSVNSDVREFDVAINRRGYFVGEQLQKFGELHFQNGSYYVGGFKDGQFDRYGMLVEARERKWVYGVYRRGEIVDLMDSSTSNTRARVAQIQRSIHEYEDTYIKSHVKLSPSAPELSEILATIIGVQKSKQNIEDPIALISATQKNYRAILDDFVSGHYQNSTEQIINQQLSKQKKGRYRKFVQTIPIKQSPQRNHRPQWSPQRNNKPVVKPKSTIKKKLKKQLSNQKYEIKIISPGKQGQGEARVKQANGGKEELKVKIDESRQLHTAESSHRTPTHQARDTKAQQPQYKYWAPPEPRVVDSFPIIQERIRSLKRLQPYEYTFIGPDSLYPYPYPHPYLTHPTLGADDVSGSNYFSKHRYYKYLEQEEAARW